MPPLIFAQGITTEWVPLLIQLATAGGFGALVWYLIVKHLPDVEVRHKKEREESEARWAAERHEWLQYIEKRDVIQNSQAAEFVQVMIRMEALVLKSQRKSQNES